jgi:ribosomal protein L2
VILEAQTPLRLTPTREAQTFTKLSAGELARVERERGNYVYVRLASDAAGWVEKTRVGRIGGR